MSVESWLLFCSIALVATITPGPAILLVTTHSLQFGVLRSLATIAGNISGLFSMSACSVLGLSTLILMSTPAFTMVRLIGAAYLIWLGIRLWRSGIAPTAVTVRSGKRPGVLSLYAQGILVSLTNPKAIAFTMALFPQFINASEPLALQFAILVATFMALSVICLLAWSLAAHRVRSGSAGMMCGRLTGRLFGSAFIGAGALLAGASQK